MLKLDTPIYPEQLDAEIRKLLARVMRSPECRLSRLEICHALSRRINPQILIDSGGIGGAPNAPGYEDGAGLPVSMYMLNAYCAQYESKAGKKLRFPAFLVPSFCEVVGDFELLRLIVGQHLPRLLELEKERKAAARAKAAKGRRRK
jgi:hypothetical protein